MSPEQKRAVSRKGGSKTGVKKGLALLTPEKRSDIARQGALAMHEKKRKKKEEEHEQDSIPEWDGSGLQSL